MKTRPIATVLAACTCCISAGGFPDPKCTPGTLTPQSRKRPSNLQFAFQNMQRLSGLRIHIPTPSSGGKCFN